MKREIAEILEKALELPPEARAAIAGSLLESLDRTVDDDAESAWEQEVFLRLKELDEGKVQPVPWAELRRRLARK
ncbi:MAG: addiction module protein [Desulfomonile tiedjei]|nr:addiction module protein [Desulfomonile tiedjei]